MEIEKVMNLSDLKPIKTELLDLKQFNNKMVRIESAKIIQVPSTFTPLQKGSQTEHIPQWVLKISSEPVASIGEGDEKIEIRATEFFNLVQDDDGNLIGYPENDKSNLMKFMKDVNAKALSELIGKNAMIKAFEKEQVVEGKRTTRTFLKFKY